MKRKDKKSVKVFRGFLTGACKKNSRAFIYRLSAFIRGYKGVSG